MILKTIHLGDDTAPGTNAFTTNRYVNAATFKLVINGTNGSVFEITNGLNRKFAFDSGGQYTMDGYGSGAFAGVATKWLAVTAAGLVIEETPPSPTTVTGDNAITVTANNVQLGSSSSTGQPLLHHTFIYGNSTFTLNFNAARVELAKGTDVTAANDLTLGLDGNVFTITGNTQINAITVANWQAGSEVDFVFSGTPTLKHNTAGGAGTAKMLLSGSVDYLASANDTIKFLYDGTSWHELARKIAATGGNDTNFAKDDLTATGDRVHTFAGNTCQITFNSLAGDSGLKLSSTSTAAASNAQFLVEIAMSGANSNSNQTTRALSITNTHTGTGATNYGIYATVSNEGFGSAIRGDATTNNGVYGKSTSGVGVNGESSSNVGVYGTSTTSAGGQFLSNPSSTNTAISVVKIIRTTSGTAANNIGGQIEFEVQTASAFNRISNNIASIWTDATDATRTSQLLITGTLSASPVNLMKLNGNGSWQITPITATAASAITPAEGMMLFVSTTDATFTTIGFWGYANGAWAAF